MFALKNTCHSFINGNYSAEVDQNNMHPNFHPATNSLINNVVYANTETISEAIESSQAAFKEWSQWTINQRSEILLKTAALLRSKVEELALLEVWDTGKPIAEALSVDIFSAADALEYFAKIALALESQVMPHPDALIYTLREPLGVCVGIGAWNYPLQIACWKAAPALIMGNSMIFKPSELTPMTALVLAELFIEAGMPKGVFNVLLGDGVVAEQLLADPRIAKISFTGSVATGKRILQQAAAHLRPVTLELGGKSPLVIFDDADIDQAVIGSMLANFYTQGEICSNGTRVYVARSIHDEFLQKLKLRMKPLKIGNPFNKTTQIGALISPEHLTKVANYVQRGKASGAELIYGGEISQPEGLTNGNFFEPTVFTQCTDNMELVRDEIFGPVMSVLVFDEEDEVIHRANDTPYGLAAGLFSKDIKRGHRVAKQLQAGVCWVNNYNVTPVSMPFGGTKHSGFGRENGLVALLNYSQLKSVYVELKEIVHGYD